MKIEYVEEMVSRIACVRGDFEAAHSMEDALYKEFIQHVANTNKGKLGELAKAVLKSKEINFSRYCA